MKKIISALLMPICFVLLSACSQHTTKKMTIEATLSHPPRATQKVYLDVLKPTETVTIDTTSFGQNDSSFQFHLYATKEAALYRIRIGDAFTQLLVAGKHDIRLSGDYLQQSPLTIQGSPASEELQNFLSQLNQRNVKLRKLSESIYNPDQLLSDSMTYVKRQQLIKEKKALRQHILKKAKTTSHPTIALFALSILDNHSLQEKGKAIIKGLPDRFPGNFAIQNAVNHFVKKFNNSGNNLTAHVGDPAPELKFPDPTGKQISLSSYEGQYVLIDFWASWCAPCRKENKNWVQLYKRFKDKNFSILGVSLDSKKSAWTEAIKKDGLPWSQISDLKGWSSTPADIYQVNAIPANFLVNPKGKIIAKDLPPKELTKKLEQLLPH